MLQQLIGCGALAAVPDELQWSVRMLLPKQAACSDCPPRRPSPAAAAAASALPSRQLGLARPPSVPPLASAPCGAASSNGAAPSLQPQPSQSQVRTFQAA